MARGLYQRFPVFRAELDRCAEILSAEDIDLIEALYGRDDPSQSERLALTGVAATGHFFGVLRARPALAELGGERPRPLSATASVNSSPHCLAGVFSLPDALG